MVEIFQIETKQSEHLESLLNYFSINTDPYGDLIETRCLNHVFPTRGKIDESAVDALQSDVFR